MTFPPTIKKWIKSFSLLLLLWALALSVASAQGQKELENKRKRLIKKIRLTTKRLNETTRSKAAMLDRYLALQQQIEARQALIQTLQQELDFANQNIGRTVEVVAALETDISRLEKEYAQMARQAYRQKLTHSKLMFLLSASSLNQMRRRWRYLRQYDRYRQKQASLILNTKEALSAKLSKLEDQRLEKEELLLSEQEQQQVLNGELEAKTKILKSLKSNEERLRRELAQQRKTHQKLNNAIEAMIKGAMADRRRQERSNKRPNPTNSSPRAPAAGSERLTGSFSSNRGTLPWPVSNGVVTRYFGKQQHPSLKKITITNNGIDIRTDPDAKVKAVFEGEVVGTQFIPGYNHMLILKHGSYYTVYSNLKNVQVRKGDQVKMRQPLGEVSVDSKTNKSEVHFELWRDKVRLNPLDWIIQK
ncbi:MAG: peptidoglycan DD-metalloendopeptidase family protein [Bacteroidota bacterium]